MAQGELQGALSNLQTICRIIAPLLWSNLYAMGGGNWLYFGAASGASVQFLLSMVIGRSEQVRIHEVCCAHICKRLAHGLGAE